MTTADLARLWNELADYPAAHFDEALMRLMTVLCDWLRADNATWVGSVRMAHGVSATRDRQGGWRIRAVQPLRRIPDRDKLIREALLTQDTGPAMTTIALTRSAGTFRVHRLRDGFVDFDAFRATANYRAFYRAPGLRDRMWAVVPVNADCESCLFFDTHVPRRRFSPRDAQLAADALRDSTWFHRRLLLGNGLLLAHKALSPSQRKLLRLLLTDRAEASIATELGLTRATTHTYITRLYRHLGVNSRAGLMALWLQG
jgi:DNA-binding CsgD family transcriptional regulator